MCLIAERHWKSTPHACLEENTTWDLVADIEKVRQHLDIPEWQATANTSSFVNCNIYPAVKKPLEENI